jgi:transposase
LIRGVASDAIRARSRGGSPPTLDPDACKGHNIVERAINRLKDFRAVAARYDKRGRNYLAVVTGRNYYILLL